MHDIHAYSPLLDIFEYMWLLAKDDMVLDIYCRYHQHFDLIMSARFSLPVVVDTNIYRKSLTNGIMLRCIEYISPSMTNYLTRYRVDRHGLQLPDVDRHNSPC